MSGNGQGPRLALLGGVHGDEPEGVVAVLAILHELERREVKGSVVAVPVSAPAAYAAGTRVSGIDGENLARAFPGKGNGTPTARVARALTREVIGGSDLLIDLHSAGEDYRMPLFCGAVSDGSRQGAVSVSMAKAFGAPLTWLHESMNPGRSISAAWESGIPAIYAETGGGGSLRADDVEAYTAGVLNVMSHMEMISGSMQLPSQQPRYVLAGGAGNVDEGITAPITGWCISIVNPGEVVGAGSPLARILDERGRHYCWVKAPSSACVMMIRHRAAIEAGDLVAMLGPVPQVWESSVVDSAL